MFGGFVLLAAIAVGLFVAGSHRALNRPNRGWSGEQVDVVFEPGLGAGAMISRLHSAGVLRHPRLLRGWLAVWGGSARLQAGEYRFDEPISALALLKRLEAGDVVLHPVTVPEGFSLEKIAVRMAEAGLGTEQELLTAFGDPARIRELDAEAEDLEGYLFPDTYLFPRGATPAGVVEAMLGRFREVVGPDFAERAGEAGLTVREAVTLASMIERETSLDEERGRISRVFHNRLERRMRMQCDPTVRYALKRDGRDVDRLTYDDLEYDSPWNTYVVYGLPPGPIANPGEGSLRAAVEPLDGNELYFVAAPEGGHTFSANLRAHEKAVVVWRRYLRSSR